MNKQEVARILTAIASLDDRIDPDEARVFMWFEVLDPTMTFEFAKQTVINHYAKSKTVMMPSDFNLLWKTEHRRIIQKELDERLKLESQNSIPIPEEIAKQIRHALNLPNLSRKG